MRPSTRRERPPARFSISSPAPVRPRLGIARGKKRSAALTSAPTPSRSPFVRRARRANATLEPGAHVSREFDPALHAGGDPAATLPSADSTARFGAATSSSELPVGAAATIAPASSTRRDAAVDVPRHAHRYFRRPVNPSPASHPGLRPAPPDAPRGRVPADVPAADALHRARLAAADAVAAAERERIEALNAPRSKTVGTQSTYRESEAQTIPYEPEYYAPDPSERTAKQAALAERNATEGGAPELLSIRHLTFASGLPAGAAEAEHIEKMRAKRAFEASLPPLSDAASLPLRKRLMEEWEEAEWAEREMEIARLQEERLDILRRAIDAREEKAERVAEARLRRMRDGMLSEKHKKFASIQAKRLKALRKLGKNRAASFEDGDENKGSIVDEYADHASKKYVPDPVRGLVAHPKIDTAGYLLDGVSHGSLDDAKAFYESIPTEAYEWDAETAMARVFETRAPKVRVWEQSAGGGVEEKRAEAVLDAMYEEMQREKRKAAAAGNDAGDDAPGAVTPEPATPGAVTPGGTAVASTPKPVASKRGPERPETPTMPPPMESEDAAETYRAVVRLQSLLRGRAEQNETFAGRERRRELIAELRLGETETGESLAIEPRGVEGSSAIERAAGAAGAAILRVLATRDPAARDAAFERTDLAARERDAAEMDAAAARIQAIQRGRVARRKAAAERPTSHPDSPGAIEPGDSAARASLPDLAGFDESERGMILKIQAAARGRAARRSVECIRRGEDPDSWRTTRNAPRPPPPPPTERPLTPEEEEALDVAGLTPEEKAAVAKMQASARDLLLRGEAPADAPGEMSPAQTAAVAKIQASAKLHLARSDAVAAALDESASVKVDAVALNDASRMLQATARAHLERAAAVDASPAVVDASPAVVDASPAVVDASSAVVDADANLDVAALDPDSKDKVVTMQASARAHVERVRSAADASKDSAKPGGLARQPSRRASRRGGGLMRRDSFKHLELEGASVGDAGAQATPDSPGAATAGSFSADDHPVPVTMSSRARRNSLTGAPDVGSSPAAFQDAGATYTEEDEVHIVKIQAATRGHLARRKSRKAAEEAAEAEAAATKIQSAHRARAARREAAALRAERAEQETAAVKIQAVHRGRAARKQISAQREGGPVQ